MPQFDTVYPYLSYVTAAGDEIVLSCREYTKWWECYGRVGFAAPPLKNITQEYADGAMDTLAIEIAPRKLTVQMVISGETSLERDRVLADIANRLIQIGHKRDWGRLRIQKTDGSFSMIDCAYIGGMETMSQTLPRVQLFSLNFYSGKGYFYDDTTDTYSFDIYQSAGLLHFGTSFHFSSATHFLSAGMNFTREISIEGFRAYPVITVTGPADDIRFENVNTGRIIEFDPLFFLLTGESVTIDTNPFKRSLTITRADGSTENGFNWLTENSNLDWFLEMGANEVVYRNINNNSVTTCTLEYHQRRLSA